MGDPAADPAHGEDAGEGFAREAQRFQQQGGVELHIGVERAIGFLEPELRQGSGLHGFGQAAPPTAIDWILVSAHFRIQDAWIDRARQGELYPSDHYPLAALIDW